MFTPRWQALSKLINPKNNDSDENLITSAIMVAGDSNMENHIGIAKGFP